MGAPVSASREFLGHPRGLAYIAFTEAWERFSFYGMQALLMLYMTGHLLHPGVVENVAGFAAFRAGVEAVFGGEFEEREHVGGHVWARRFGLRVRGVGCFRLGRGARRWLGACQLPRGPPESGRRRVVYICPRSSPLAASLCS